MTIPIWNCIQIPSYDVDLLAMGKLIAVPFKQSLKRGQVFWIYPSQQLPYNLIPEQCYQPQFLVDAKAALSKAAIAPIKITTWGVVESHWHIYVNERFLLPKIAQSTIWNLEALEHIFEQNNVLKLLFLRVYYLSEACIVQEVAQPGLFCWLQDSDKSVSATKQDTAVVSSSSFSKRKASLMAGKINPFLALESLQLQLAYSPFSSSSIEDLKQDIKQLLGWSSSVPIKHNIPSWIHTIAALGDRSLMEDEGKSNYQAGTDFENVIRQSLEFLGFKVDMSHRGGAGGIDIFCSQPYPLVGECKSGKKIPNDTAVQLLNLGTLRLSSKEEFAKSVKLIIGPGEPTEQLSKASKVHGMSILNPQTIEKLAKLHCRYPIDLYRLRDYLVDGQSDEEVEKFINETIQAIELRSLIIKLVKHYLENANSEDASIFELHAVYIVSKPPHPLSREEMHEILLELSSPLVGHLGRNKDKNGVDHFYFLRDLPIAPL